MSVAIALPAAFAYGVADFTGGLATRRAPVLAVTTVVQATGLVVMLPAVFLVSGTPSVAAFAIGALAGIAGAAGLLLYLRALALGPMGVVAPLSAVVGAGLPLLIGVLGGERPGPVTLVAVAVALVAILLATSGTSRTANGPLGPLLGLAAGVGFGLFFIGMDATPPDSGLWPLLAGRVTSVVLLCGISLVARTGSRPTWLMIVSGVVDSLANAGFLLAARLGDLGVSAVVVSLYPIVVVVLARVVLGERLSRLQLTSAGLALGASVLLAATS